MSSQNKYKYDKYKTKYLKLRREVENILQEDKKVKKSFETYEGNIVPYHEEYIENIPDSLITKDPAKPSNKVLIIDNVNSFDVFTKLYAKEVYSKKFMYVRWEQVAQNFLGFYINCDNKDLYLTRYEMINYKDKDMFDSWWKREYDNVNVVIFDK